jgi:sulfate permease, SulP family
LQLTHQIHFRNLPGDLFGGVTAAVIAHFIAAYPENEAYGMAMAFTVVMMAGVFQIIFGSALQSFKDAVDDVVFSGE